MIKIYIIKIYLKNINYIFSMVLLMDNIYIVKYIDYFNNFIKQLKIIFQDDDDKSEDNILSLLDNINMLSNEDKVNHGNNFISMLSDDKYFELFMANKIKLFSHKEIETKNISESLFNEKLSLKKILNNQNDEIKTIIWTYLHTFYLLLQFSYEENLQNKDRINQLNSIIKLDINGNNNNIKPIIESQLKKIIGSNINTETSDMINDIVSSFDSILQNTDSKNPFSGIFDISQKISQKYSDKINKGDIEMDKIMNSITTNIPGMDKIMDKLGNMENIVSQFTNQDDSSKTEDKIVIDENYSTANIDVGVDKEDKKSDFKIGNILKIADDFGVLPGTKKNDSGDNQEESKSDAPDFSKIMNLMKKMNNSNSTEDLENIKNEMNHFYKNELGLDIDKISSEIGLNLMTPESIIKDETQNSIDEIQKE
jgi:hypothetical protein